jgi:cytochrome c oxidase subunit II
MHRFRFLLAVMLATTAACSSSHPVTSEAVNGRSIFQTGRDTNGTQIVAVPPALRQNCAACHRMDGSGGLHLPDGAVSADLRHQALVTDQKHPYTLALLERAISTGTDNEGQRLNPVMPRWKLSSADLHDVAYYVFTALK